ncbi:MAG: ABC transporter substrate-binding protein [Acidimicrobiia bacterium]|nr:ABC transporter substrate-binding protein [Acidimicrobiia bacterium]
MYDQATKGSRRWLWLALVLAMTMVAASCGDDSTETAAGGDGDCETVDEVSLQLQWVAQAQFAGYYAAVDEGFYAARCLDVTIVEGGVDIVPQQQLASGAVDYAISWVPKALVTREAEGIDIVNVAQIFQRSGTLQVSFTDAGIGGPADFAGKKIGNWGFGNEFEMLAGARSAGLEPGTDFELVQQAFDMNALIQGEIDAAQAMTYNEYAQVLETVNPDTGELYQPENLTVIDWNDVGTAMLQDAIWADGTKLGDEAYADQTTRFIAASVEGWMWCRDNAEACVEVVLNNGPTLGASHQTWQLNEINKLIWPSPGGAGVMDSALWDQTIEVSLSEGVLAAAPDDAAYTTEYAQAALDLIGDADVTGDDWAPVTVTLNEGGE